MERSVTEELAEVLKNNKKKADFLTMSQLNIALPTALRKRLELTKNSKGEQIERAVSPHLGEKLMFRRVNKSVFLTSKLSGDNLLFEIVKKNDWKIPKIVPFKASDIPAILSQLLEKDALRIRKINKDYKPLLFAPGDGTSQLPKQLISEEKFKEAYSELERGKFYVRICDLRRHLGWAAQEFNTMLTGLRDAGKIQLRTGDTDFFTEEDVRDSFFDENGFRKLTITWRQ